MKRLFLAIPAALMAALGVAAATGQAPPPQAPATVAPAASHATGRTSTATSIESQTALVKQDRAGCHSDRGKAGGLSLAAFDASAIEQHPELAEKMIRKLRAGMMPPAGAKRPDEATLTAFATSIETRIDRVAAVRPNPGRRPFQRLNRAEYAAAIEGLLGIDVDVSALLPPDTISTASTTSPTCRRFLHGARRVSACGGQDQPRRARRPDGGAIRRDLQSAAHRGAAAARRRARQLALVAARPWCTSFRQTASTPSA